MSTASRLRVGVQLPEVERQVPWPEYVAMARAAEEVGFDSIWVGDHLLYRDDGRDERGPWDAWSLLSALAAVTDRVRLGPLVACCGFCPAGLLARKAAAIQEINDGRLVLGLGAGWNETEFGAFGIPFDHRASRVQRVLRDHPPPARRGAGDVRWTVRARPGRGAAAPTGRARSTDDRFHRGARLAGRAGPRQRLERLVRLVRQHPRGLRQRERPRHPARSRGRTRTVRCAPQRHVFITFDDGGRDRPHTHDASALTGSPETIANGLASFAAAGLQEAILVVSPITERTIRRLGHTVTALNG